MDEILEAEIAKHGATRVSGFAHATADAVV
jgi:hypothetical protein